MNCQDEVISRGCEARTSGMKLDRQRPRKGDFSLKAAKLACLAALALAAQNIGCASKSPSRTPTQRPVPRAVGAMEPAHYSERTGKPHSTTVQWRAELSRPRPSVAAGGALAELLSMCGQGDGALDEVAYAMARIQADGRPPAEIDQVVLFLRAAGAAYVWPRAWSLAGRSLDPPTIREPMTRWLATFDGGGQRRCGLAKAASLERGTEVFAMVVVDTMAVLRAPIPARARSGTWLTFDAAMLVPADAAKLVVLGPTGAPYSVPSTLSEGRVRSRVRVDRPGEWKIQLLSTVAGGPRPALEAVVWVDTTPPETVGEARAPGETLARREQTPPEQLFAMISAVRAEEGLRPLRRVPALDTLALEHSVAMRDAGRIGHDVGKGTPKSRILEAFPQTRRAGENVAHAASIVRAHRSLWASPSHRGNLLDAEFNAVGLGVAGGPDGTVWVTEVFSELE